MVKAHPQQVKFLLEGGVGFCNAIRRTLAGHMSMWAPYELTIRVNSSCHADELIAHRIGMIPFKRIGNGDTMELRAHGPCIVSARDFVGPAFEAVYSDIVVVELVETQVVDLTIHFDRRDGNTHARYSPCAAVGMVASGEKHVIVFHTIDGRSELELMVCALDDLEARVDRALVALAHQPAEAPKSMC